MSMCKIHQWIFWIWYILALNIWLNRFWILNQFKVSTINSPNDNTGQQTFCPGTKPLVSIQFLVAESESGIRFFHYVRIMQYCQFHGCQVWKLVFRVFRKKLWEISKIWPDIGDSKLNSAHFKKKKLKIGSAVLEILAI